MPARLPPPWPEVRVSCKLGWLCSQLRDDHSSTFHTQQRCSTHILPVEQGQFSTGPPHHHHPTLTPTISRPQVIHAAVSSPEWARLAAQRSWHYVWLPDDDIAAPTCTVTRFLRTMEANQLLLAQVRWLRWLKCNSGAAGGLLPLAGVQMNVSTLCA